VSVKEIKSGWLLLVTVAVWDPESAPHTPSQEERAFSVVRVARDVLAASGVSVVIGTTLVNQVTDERYRVVKIDDNGQDIGIDYKCETSKPA
jgi:hypothetical protein